MKLKSFSAHVFVSESEIRFIARCWGEGGFLVNEFNNPITDCNGNKVRQFSMTEIHERDSDLLAEAYSGFQIPDQNGFVDWMKRGGIDTRVIKNVTDEICRKALADTVRMKRVSC